MVETPSEGMFERKQAPANNTASTGADGRTAKKKRGPKIGTVRQAQRQLADVYRRLKAGEMKASQGAACVNALRSWIEAEVTVKAEEEIAEIRAQIAAARGTGSK